MAYNCTFALSVHNHPYITPFFVDKTGDLFAYILKDEKAKNQTAYSNDLQISISA